MISETFFFFYYFAITVPYYSSKDYTPNKIAIYKITVKAQEKGKPCVIFLTLVGTKRGDRLMSLFR